MIFLICSSISCTSAVSPTSHFNPGLIKIHNSTNLLLEGTLFRSLFWHCASNTARRQPVHTGTVRIPLNADSPANFSITARKPGKLDCSKEIPLLVWRGTKMKAKRSMYESNSLCQSMHHVHSFLTFPFTLQRLHHPSKPSPKQEQGLYMNLSFPGCLGEAGACTQVSIHASASLRTRLCTEVLKTFSRLLISPSELKEHLSRTLPASFSAPSRWLPVSGKWNVKNQAGAVFREGGIRDSHHTSTSKPIQPTTWMELAFHSPW